MGRGRPYLEHLLPRLRELFPAQYGDLGPETLYRAANEIEPSLIRVEADQVTYNLHIVLRFELEVELFEGRLEPADLPEAWNARMADYLGLEVPDDAAGRASGRPLVGRGVRLLPHVLAGQRDGGPDLGPRDRGAPGSRGADRRGRARSRCATGSPIGSTGTAPSSCRRRCSSGWSGGPIDVTPYVRQLRERAVEIYGI